MQQINQTRKENQRCRQKISDVSELAKKADDNAKITEIIMLH